LELSARKEAQQDPDLKNNYSHSAFFEGRAEYEDFVSPYEVSCEAALRAVAILKRAIMSDGYRPQP
jgi:hypothetical protein